MRRDEHTAITVVQRAPINRPVGGGDGSGRIRPVRSPLTVDRASRTTGRARDLGPRKEVGVIFAMINADNTVGNGSRRDRRRDKDASGGVPPADYLLIAVRSVLAFPFSFSRRPTDCVLAAAASSVVVCPRRPRRSPVPWSVVGSGGGDGGGGGIDATAANNSRPATSCGAR